MKLLPDSSLIPKAERALLDCLAVIPCFATKSILQEQKAIAGKVNLLIRLQSPQGEYPLLAEVKATGLPGTARNAANQLLRYQTDWPNSYGVFVAPYISPATAEVCRQEGIGYVDLAGNCRLAFGCVYIERTGNANPLAVKRDLRTLYSPKAERVLRVLLAAPHKFWQVQQLAQEAQVSIGLASNAKKLLDNREWLQKAEQGAAFALGEPGELLTEWVQSIRPDRSRSVSFYSLQTLPDIERSLAEYCQQEQIAYTLTELSGAARYAPYVRHQRAAAYVSGDLETLARRLNWKPVTSGANVTLLTPYDDGVYYGSKEVESVRVASPVQVYLDLQGAKGRSDEAATFLREEVIEPAWT